MSVRRYGVSAAVVCTVVAALAWENNARAVWNLPPGASLYSDQSDTDTFDANVVVSLAATPDGPSACTGTLLTAKLVLTAASCKSAAKAGPTPFVRIGGAVPYQQTVASTSFVTFASNPAGEPSLSGQDIGLVSLADYVIAPARAHHPPFVAPPPVGAPSAVGRETFDGVGIAGWSPYDAGGTSGAALPFAVAKRQWVAPAQMDLYRYWTLSAALEPFWVVEPFSTVGVPRFGLAAGDSGAPMFVVRDGRRDVVGVASIIGDPPDPALRGQALPAIANCAPLAPGTATACTAWVDITNAAVRGWIAAHATDTSRGPRWLATHPRVGVDQGSELWIGDLDYYGACDAASDSDCDHVWDRNADGSGRDNCRVANIDQLDSDDDGLGDACDSCPTSNAVCSAHGGSVACGATTDTCGQNVDCGGCTGGLSCVSNACRHCQTCADLGATCGTVTNDCGQALNCGGCANGSQCQANQCVACQTTCPWSCGGFTNNCGVQIACGTCPAGDTCTNNRCVAVPKCPGQQNCGDHCQPLGTLCW